MLWIMGRGAVPTRCSASPGLDGNPQPGSGYNADLPPALERKTMEWKALLTVFSAVFIAELGDKTQLATMLFAADAQVSRWTVFFGASAALIVASGLGVLAGTLLAETINERLLQTLAGGGFIAIGAFTLFRAWGSS